MIHIDPENEYRIVAGFEAIVVILSVAFANPTHLPFELLATVSIAYGFGISILIIESLATKGMIKGRLSQDQWGFSVLILSTASTLLTKNGFFFVAVLIANLFWLGYRYKSNTRVAKGLLAVSPMLGESISLSSDKAMPKVFLMAIREQLVEILSYLIAIIMVSFLTLAPEFNILLKVSGCSLAAFRLILVAANKQKSPSSIS